MLFLLLRPAVFLYLNILLISKARTTNQFQLVLWPIFHVLHNVFLHPLRNFPGPKLWAATRFPWCWYQYNGTLNQRLLELHTKYGHTVRIAPNELSFTTAEAWKAVYGHRSVEMSKDPVFRLHSVTGVQSKQIYRI